MAGTAPLETLASVAFQTDTICRIGSGAVIFAWCSLQAGDVHRERQQKDLPGQGPAGWERVPGQVPGSPHPAHGTGATPDPR